MKKLLAVLSIALAVTLPMQVNAKTHVKKPVKTKSIKSKKAIEACVDKWVDAYHSEPGWEDHPISYDQFQEWEDWCKKDRTPKNYKP